MRRKKVLLLVGVALVLFEGVVRDCMAILGLTDNIIVGGGLTTGAMLVVAQIVRTVGYGLVVVCWLKVGGNVLDYFFKE